MVNAKVSILLKGKPPFFGFVKRAMNRAPGKSDYWFSAHLKECGGEFVKISAPEDKPKAKAKPKEKSQPIEKGKL